MGLIDGAPPFAADQFVFCGVASNARSKVPLKLPQSLPDMLGFLLIMSHIRKRVVGPTHQHLEVTCGRATNLPSLSERGMRLPLLIVLTQLDTIAFLPVSQDQMSAWAQSVMDEEIVEVYKVQGFLTQRGRHFHATYLQDGTQAPKDP